MRAPSRTRVEPPKVAIHPLGSMFDVTTAAALALPAIVPIRTFPVRVEREDIYVRV